MALRRRSMQSQLVRSQTDGSSAAATMTGGGQTGTLCQLELPNVPVGGSTVVVWIAGTDRVLCGGDKAWWDRACRLGLTSSASAVGRWDLDLLPPGGATAAPSTHQVARRQRPLQAAGERARDRRAHSTKPGAGRKCCDRRTACTVPDVWRRFHVDIKISAAPSAHRRA